MKFWWLTDLKRLAAEKAAVEMLAKQEDWFRNEKWLFHQGQLAVHGVITVHGHEYRVRLIYPDQFPNVPAWVEPQSEERWSHHQYGKKTLCLELRPDNWVPNATGADVLRSAMNLLLIENPLGESGSNAPSAHRVGELQSYQWGGEPVLIGERCKARILDGSSVGLKALRWMAFDEVWPSLIHDEADRISSRRPPGADINSWRFECPVYVGSGAAPEDPADRVSLTGTGLFPPGLSQEIEGEGSALVVFVADNELSAFYVSGTNKPQLRHIYVLPEEGGVRSGHVAPWDKSVAVVGTGSVGSKIAEHLVRAGVQTLTLVDGDVLLPANLERHTLDWRDVGFRKVHGVKRKLLNIMPSGNFAVVAQNLNWQRSASTHAWQVDAIASCDVIVDATGDPASSLFLGAVAYDNQRAFFSAEVFEGGIGGLVSTSFPDTDPPYSDGRAAFLGWCAEQGKAPPESGSRPYEMLADGGATVVADDAAVSAIAASAARLVMDFLGGVPRPDSTSFFLLGLKSAWLFDGFGHTIRLNVGARLETNQSEDYAEARAFVIGLLGENSGETEGTD